ncbi:MAG: efflux RND transporter permease subunit [bacterium]|nr:efflux RND transporter permease subunit [Gammaproteobacteria bacterium]HIL97239.1 efflux RND transporter permease subunit [Pseudomonadales bacterium]
MSSYVAVLIDRSRTIISLLCVILLAGFVSYKTIPLEAKPDVSIPIIIVTVPHEGISPQDAERLLARPMELELKNVEGVKEINSYSGEGSATIVIEFDYSFESEQALLDVHEAVDKAKVKIPSSADEPIVNEVAAGDFPIITITLGGEGVPDRVLYKLARSLKDELESIPEVLEANLNGQREELLEAIVDPSQLEAYGITNEELIGAVSRNNRLIAAGAVDTGKGSFSVKIPSVIETAKDILSIPVKATSNGVVTLADVTTIRRTFKDARGYTRANSIPAVAVELSKRKGASLIAAVDKIKTVVEATRVDFPANVSVGYMADQAPETLDQINTLEGNISTAMFLVLTVVVAAVGVRSGLLVAMGIPFSFLFAFIVVNALGFTYNFMVMFGMLLGLGMLIDGAIVIIELADRKMTEGTSPRDAYVYSIKRMFWPVLASTGTTLAAFLPLMFWPGVVGGFMKYLPVTVFAVLFGSLAYALIFAPVLGTLLSKQQPKLEGGNVLAVDEGRFEDLTGVLGYYARVLRFTTDHPLLVIGITFVCLLSIVRAYSVYGNGMQFFTEVDPTFAGIDVAAKGNYSASEVRDIVTDVEQRITGVGYINSIYTRTGSGGVRGGSGSSADQIGNMFIELSDRRTRDISGWDIENQYREAIEDIPGVRAEVRKQESGPPVGKDIQIQLSGDDLEILASETRRIRKFLESMDGLTSVDDTAPVPGIEWEVKVDRVKAAMLGADVVSVGAAIQLVTNGILVGKYRPDDVDDEVDIRVRYPKEYRTVTRLDALRVSTRDGQVPLSSFVERKAKPKVSTIFRQNGQRVMYVRANTMTGVLASDKVNEIAGWLEDAAIDPSLQVVFRGSNEEQNKSMSFIGKAFSLALALMGILLVTQFNSFYQAALILSAVVMSTCGVLLGLLVLDQSFSAIMTGVGIVALAGIIVNNNIVLIDTFNYLHKENPGWTMQRVVMQTGCLRIRPVFLTTFTTGFGLLPMASGVSVDLLAREIEVGGPIASFWVLLASSIVSGLSFATVLTLIVTPALLMAPHAIRALIVKFRGEKDGIPTLTVDTAA